MSESTLLVSRDGAIVTLQFNRPEALNALDVAMAHAFLAAMREIAADKAVRAVVLKGAGRAFIAAATSPRCAPIRCRACAICSRR